MISKTLIFFGIFFLLGFSSLQVNAFPNYDYDNKADFGVFRPTDRQWYTYSTGTQTITAMQWGLETDQLVPADYDGDGLTDYAVWRPQTGDWYVLRSSDKTLLTVNWGITPHSQPPIISLSSPDVPVVGDYDGDGTADFAVWRPDTGVWYILKSTSGFSPNYAQTFQWGMLGDIPVPADYDGDGKTDYAVFRPGVNRWYIFLSSTQQWQITTFGIAGNDLLVPADYTGDGKADIAVYRKGVWYIERSQDKKVETYQFGLPTDKPVPADYDGDGKTDVAVFRNGIWFIYQSSDRQVKSFNFGAAGDIPINSINVKESVAIAP